MNFHHNTRLAILSFSLILCVPAQAAPDWVEVAPGAYARQGQDGQVFETAYMANTGIVVGERCVALIDTGGSQQEGKEILAKAAELSDKPVCYVINTHHHPDHYFGNAAFHAHEQTRFIAHANLQAALNAAMPHYKPRASEFEGRDVQDPDFPPLDTVLSPGDAPLLLDLGGRTLRVEAQPTAHTHADLSVIDETYDVLWAGDLLFSSHIPVVDGSVLGWLEVSRQLHERASGVVVPGHGQVKGDRDDFTRQTDYLSELRDTIRGAVAKGQSLMDVTTQAMQDNPWGWTQYEAQYKRNLTNVYTELEWE